MHASHTPLGDPGLAAKLQRAIRGDVRFDPFSRGRYSTDASIYQIEPIGVVIPRTVDDVIASVQIAAEEGVPILPRGAGTSQAGQTVGRALVIDTSKHLTRWSDLDTEQRTITVEPGVVLDHLNTSLKPHGLFFPVDVATSSQATLGGMVGNNSAGTRSIQYGLMVDNVHEVEALLSDGRQMTFGPVPAELSEIGSVADADAYREIVRRVRALYLETQDELETRIPKVLRHVAGYNLHRLSLDGHNMAALLVGSEGTLAFFTRITLTLAPLPPHKVLGVCHFPSLAFAMDAVRYIVELKPSAVELVDRTLLDLANRNPSYQAALSRFVRGDPEALLLVELTGDDPDVLKKRLADLDEVMTGLGFPDRVVTAVEPALQSEIWSVRKAGLNIVMSMRGDQKPVSFIEDCAVPLERLAEYTDRLSEIFRKHGTSGTWYAHASVGCLHVRPILNLKDGADVKRMREIAEEAHELVRNFKGSHSGEHGDGIVRSEFLGGMLGPKIVHAFEEIKRCFDPTGLFNPGKIVNSQRMDDRQLLRYGPDYTPLALTPALDWRPWNGLAGAAEMCNNNGVCRKAAPAVMCPSFRVTHDETHVTRGRANTLRLALTGQLGPDAFTSPAMYETLDLCISCKACRRECPTGVDMAKMKIEFLHHYYAQHGIPRRKRLIAYLPRYAPTLSRTPALLNLRDRVPGLARVTGHLLGITPRRELPPWRRDAFRDPATAVPPEEADVVLFVDTFNRYFEPDNVRSALTVLEAIGCRVALPSPKDRERPLCCGRTFLNAGLVEDARLEARRVIDTLIPYAEHGVPIVGLEPSCLLTFRDELTAMVPDEAAATVADHALLLEEFLVRDGGRAQLAKMLGTPRTSEILVHGHCHQKAFGTMESMMEVLRWLPGVDVQPIAAGCCGMAGSFGYESEHYDMSMAMGELELLPVVRSAGPDTWIAANGTSCRRQIYDGAGRRAVHAVHILAGALTRAGGGK